MRADEAGQQPLCRQPRPPLSIRRRRGSGRRRRRARGRQWRELERRWEVGQIPVVVVVVVVVTMEAQASAGPLRAVMTIVLLLIVLAWT